MDAAKLNQLKLFINQCKKNPNILKDPFLPLPIPPPIKTPLSLSIHSSSSRLLSPPPTTSTTSDPRPRPPPLLFTSLRSPVAAASPPSSIASSTSPPSPLLSDRAIRLHNLQIHHPPLHLRWPPHLDSTSDRRPPRRHPPLLRPIISLNRSLSSVQPINFPVSKIRISSPLPDFQGIPANPSDIISNRGIDLCGLSREKMENAGSVDSSGGSSLTDSSPKSLQGRKGKDQKRF